MADNKLFEDANGNRLPEEKAKPIFEDAKGNTLSEFQSPITKASETVAPYTGRLATEGLPFAGSFFGPGGTMIGTGLKQMMKSARPDLFGEEPPTTTDQATDALKELILNNALPRAVGKGIELATRVGMQGPGAVAAAKLSNFPSVREGVIGQLRDAIQAHLGADYNPRFGEYQPIRIAPGTAPYQPIDIQPHTVTYQPISISPGEPERFIPGLRSSPYDRAIPEYGGNPNRQQVFISPGNEDIIPNPDYSQPSPLGKLPEYSSTGYIPATKGSTIPVGGEQQVPGGTRTVPTGPIRNAPTGSYSVMPIGDIASKKGDDALRYLLSGKQIDASKALEELSGKNASIYADAMSPEVHTSMTEMLQTMKGLQKENTTDKIIQFSKGRLIWSTFGGAGVGAIFGHPIEGAVVGGLKSSPIILNSMLGRIMENPETARLVTIAMQTPKGSPQASLISEALSKILPRIVQAGADVETTPEK